MESRRLGGLRLRRHFLHPPASRGEALASALRERAGNHKNRWTAGGVASRREFHGLLCPCEKIHVRRYDQTAIGCDRGGHAEVGAEFAHWSHCFVIMRERLQTAAEEARLLLGFHDIGQRNSGAVL